MKKTSLPAVLSLFLVLLASSALAVPASKTLEFPDGDTGKVTFSGQVHKDAGLTCKDCHKPDLFPERKKGTVKIMMKDINENRLCGSCHNGKRAFPVGENCNRCHKK